jgi:RNA recognition motif-containing protein
MNIYVGNLSFETAESDLRVLFEAYGTVDSVKIISDQFTGRSRGFGFIEMATHEEGTKAVQELDSKDLGGRALKVNEAKPKRQNSGGGSRHSRW